MDLRARTAARLARLAADDHLRHRCTSRSLADTTPPLARGRAIGLNDSIAGAASISLPLLAGPFVEVVGLPALAGVSAALMIVPFVLLLRLRETAPGRYDHPVPAPRPILSKPQPAERL